MKFMYVLLAAVSFTIFSSCKKDALTGSGIIITQQRQEDDFTAISSEGTFKVTIKKGQSNVVELTGEDNVLEKVITKVINGRLTLNYSSDVSTHHHKPVTVTITASSINKVEQNGSGSIQSSDEWNTPYFDAVVNGSGSIDFRSDCAVFQGTVNGSGSLNISGSGESADFIVKGSGNILAFPFTTNDATVAVEGSGKNEVSVRTTLKATIKGSGKVYYKGNPVVSAAVNGSGGVIRSN